MLEQIIKIIEPMTFELISLVVSWFLIKIMRHTPDAINQYVGEGRMKMLHEAILTGVQSALNSGDKSEDEIMEHILNYIQESIPDTLEKLNNPSPDVIKNIALRRLNETTMTK